MRQRSEDHGLVHYGVYHDPTDSFGPGLFGWYKLCDGRELDEYSRNKTTDLNKTTCEPCLKKLHRRGLDLAKAARERIKQIARHRDPLHEL